MTNKADKELERIVIEIADEIAWTIGKDITVRGSVIQSNTRALKAFMKSQREQATNTDRVTRFEAIDQTKYGKGRVVIKHDVKVSLDLQDDNRTLKVFLTDKERDD